MGSNLDYEEGTYCLEGKTIALGRTDGRMPYSGLGRRK